MAAACVGRQYLRKEIMMCISEDREQEIRESDVESYVTGFSVVDGVLILTRENADDVTINLRYIDPNRNTLPTIEETLANIKDALDEEDDEDRIVGAPTINLGL